MRNVVISVWETKFLKHSLICSVQNSTRPGLFSTRPAQNALALASGQALVSLTAFYLKYESTSYSVRDYRIKLLFVRNKTAPKLYVEILPLPPRTNFMKALWAHNPNPVRTQDDFTWKTVIRSCHNFVNVMMAQMSWHVQICEPTELF